MTLELKIDKNVYGGDGMGRLGDGRVCFVSGVFAGERIRAEIFEQHKKFVRARCVEILVRSPDRVEPGETVPGMVYAPVSYEAELRFKEDQLANFLQRIGSRFQRIETVSGKPAAYRNKATYHVQRAGGAWKIGYRREFSHDVVDVRADPLAVPEITHRLGDIRTAVTALLTQGAKNVRRDLSERGAVTVRYTRTDGVTWWLGDAPRGKELTETTCGLAFKVPADGFYQVNPEVGEKLVEAVCDAYADGAADAPNVTDLYCGVGVFGIAAIARNPKADNGSPGRLVGIESVQGAIACAKRNAEAARVKGNFFCERTGASLRRIRVGARSTVIVDPPRGGLEKNVPAWLATCGAKRIFYVSCDPATLTRDLQPLMRTYRVRRVRLFDLFPRTARFETFVELERTGTETPRGNRRDGIKTVV